MSPSARDELIEAVPSLISVLSGCWLNVSSKSSKDLFHVCPHSLRQFQPFKEEFEGFPTSRRGPAVARFLHGQSLLSFHLQMKVPINTCKTLSLC